jgi:hypothetical protein
VIGSHLVLLLDQTHQAIERFRPHLLQHRPQGAQRFTIGSVQASSAVSTNGNKTRIAKDRKVLGYRRKTDVELGGDISGCQLAIPHQAEDLSAAGLGYNL